MASPRAHGRFISRRCPDQNCDGELQPDREDGWRCDGLTHSTDTGPLYACRVSFNSAYDEVPA